MAVSTELMKKITEFQNFYRKTMLFLIWRYTVNISSGLNCRNEPYSPRSFGIFMCLETSVFLLEVLGETTETSDQQSGLFGYRNFEFYKNLRNSYLRFGRAEIEKFYEVSVEK
jgi:hypothetical protein